MTIYDTMQAICQQKTVSFDRDAINPKKASELLYIPNSMIDSRCYDPETLVLCAFEGCTYLIDEEANLWDILPSGHLSIRSVGIFEQGVEGFAAEMVLADTDKLDGLKGCFEQDFIELVQTIDKANKSGHSIEDFDVDLSLLKP